MKLSQSIALRIIFATAVIGSVCADPVQADTLTDEGTAAGLQCSGNAVNDSGVVVGSCLNTTGVPTAFVASTAGSETVLPPLVAGQACVANAITNTGTIIGGCGDATGRTQTVTWLASQPTTAPSVLASLGGIGTIPLGGNHQGAVVGASVNGTLIATPVLWPAGQTTPVALPGPGLLGLGNTNCVALDAAPGSGTAPPIIGVCPDGSGRPAPVIWNPTGLLGAYVASMLPAPANSVSCVATRVNGASQVLGTCDFGPGVGPKTVRWSSATGPAAVLTAVNGSPRNVGVSMNANGAIIGQYLSADEVSLAFYWNPDANDVQAIPALSSGASAAVTTISDTSVVMGSSETDSGTGHAFKWTAAGGVVDLGTLTGGSNSSVSMISSNGCFATGDSEVVGHADHAFSDTLCAPGLMMLRSSVAAPGALPSLAFDTPWIFFPWHRMYLYFVERISRAALGEGLQ